MNGVNVIKYLGSKSRIAKDIVPIIQRCIDDVQPVAYLEPFVGGGNVIDKIIYPKKIGTDINPYLIGLLNHVVADGKLLNEVSRELYNEVKSKYKTGCYDDWYVGNIAFLASFNGKGFVGGFAKAGYEKTKNGLKYRDYYQEAKRNLEKQAPNLKGVFFICRDYRSFTPHEMVVYCDPPYNNTAGYDNEGGFSHEEFWQTIREWSMDNYILVSEQTAPDDFDCIWEKSVLRSVNASGKSRATEKLFTYNKGKYAEKYLR